MLSKRNYKERLRQMEQKTERFSIRKLTVGAASVLIGLSFLGLNGHTAHAETTDGSQSDSDIAQDSKTQSVDEQSNLDVKTASQDADAAQTVNADAVKSNDNVVSNNASESVKAVSTKKAVARPVVRAAAENNNNDQQNQNDPIEADAIKDGYIKAAVDTTNAKNTLSGWAYTRNTGGNVMSGEGTNGQKPVKDGVKIYMQWQDTDGAISPVYYTTVHALSDSATSTVGPGAYAFDLRKGFTVAGDLNKDGSLKEHVYNAAPGQYFTLWSEPFTDDEGIEWQPIMQMPGNTMGSWVNSTMPAKYLSGAFQFVGINMQRTAVFFGNPSNVTDWMTKPRDQWTESSVKTWKPYSPGIVGVLGNDSATTNSVSGRIWLNTNPMATHFDTQSTTYDKNKDFAYTKDDDVIVYASALTPEGMAAYKSQVQSLDKQEWPDATKKLLEAHPEYIAETVYGHVLDNEGHYDLKFSDNVNLKNVQDGIFVGAIVNGQNAATLSTYAAPVFTNPKGDWAAQVAPATPVDGMGGLLTGIKDSWNNVGLAVTPNAQVAMNIINYNLTDKPAMVGTTQPAIVKMSTDMPQLPIGKNTVQWYQNGKKIGDAINVTLASVNNDGIANLTIPANAKDGDIFTAEYSSNGNVLAQASFVVHDTDAGIYDPEYKPTDVAKGGTVTTDAPAYTPNTIDGVNVNKDGKAPEGTTYSIPDGATYPEGVTASIDKDTGKVTVTTSENTPEGPIDVPVTVTYPDGTTDTTYAPIIVGASTFVGTDYTVAVYTNLDNLHETTDNSMNVDAKSTISKIVYYNNNDLRQGKNLEGTTTSLDDVTATWTKAPNTVVATPSMSAVLPGTDTKTVSDANPTLDVKFGANSQLIKETGNNLFSTNGGEMTAKWYGGSVTMQGAVAKNPAKPVDVTTGKSELTNDQIAALINNENLNKLTANKPVDYTWATPLKAGDTTGTVRITFEDKDAQGKNTYLDIKLPAGSINVTNPTTNPTDADKYNPQGGTITVDKGHKLTDGDAENAITNHGVMPSDTTYTWKDTPDTSTTGTKSGVVTVTFPDKSAKDVPVTVIVKDNTPTNPTNENATGTPIVTEKGHMPDPSEGIGNKGDLPTGTTYTWKDGEPDVNKIGESPVTVTVHYPDGNTQDVPTTIIVTGTEKPGDPGITNPDDPNYSDLFHKVTRTISVTTPDGKTTETNQTVVFGRSKTVTAENGHAVTTYSDYTVYNTDTNKLTNDKSATLPEFDVNQIDGYTSLVNGSAATKVEAETVTGASNSSTVSVTYTKSGANPTDADKYTPQGQDVHTNVGETPSADQGIANKGDLPSGTTYTWKDTPDVSTPGTKDATIVVTYPDGSKDEVPVHVIVTDNTPSTPTTNPTDSEIYNPEPKPIDTPQGVVPDPSQGIKNPGDLPSGTTYTWTNGDPDVSTPGTQEVSITVTYPDGSTDTVITTLTVTPNEDNNETPHGTDGDNNNGGHKGNGDNGNGLGNINSGVKATNGNNHAAFYGNGKSQKTLPQTGAQDNAFGLIGLMFAGLGALVALAGAKKRED